jgi:predicted dehydrogenase
MGADAGIEHPDPLTFQPTRRKEQIVDRITRRRFLEQSLLAAAAGLAGAGLSEEAQGYERVRKAGPNDRIRIACIGVNGRGMSHVDAYSRRDDVDLVAICDVDLKAIAKAQAAVEKRGKTRPRGEQDIRKLVEDPNIDAVSIATPNHWHSLAAIWAIEHGKDVYVEKPVSHNVSEGRRLVEIARKHGRVCQAGTQSRSAKACRDAVEYIHSGKIGKVLLARGLCYKSRGSIGKAGGPQPVPEGINYDLWLGPAPEKPVMRKRFHYDWHWFWDYGNGDLGNQGIHQMDIARWALGKNTLPYSVMGLGGRFGYEDDGQTPNTELTFYDYGDSQLIFEVRGLETDGVKDVKIGDIVYGTDGYVAFSDNYGRVAAFDNQGNKVADFTGGGDHFGNFLDVVRSRKIQDLHGEILEGHLSSALCHLGNISYRLGEPQPFNPKTKAFGDNKDAYEAIGRFEQHLADNGVKLEETKYFLGPNLRFDPKAERFEHHAAHGAHTISFAASDAEDPAKYTQANALLTREYRKGFAVPNKA